jgi:hypothetical protein
MRNIFKALFTALIIGLFIIWPASSYAYTQNGHNGGYSHSGGYSHGGGYGHGWGHGYSYVGVNLSLWPDYYYYGVPYYPPVDEVLVSPPIYEPVVVNQVVQPAAAPVITTSGTTGDTADSITINIPNNKGGYTAVTLKKSGNGFIGPQGEFYPEFPKVSQLEIIYGK